MLQDRLNKLMWNKRYVSIPEEIETPNDIRHVIFKQPTVEDRNYCLFVKEDESEKNRKEGVLTEAELLNLAREMGNWTPEDDRTLREVDEHVKFLESERASQKFLARKRQLSKQIDAALEKKKEVSARRSEIEVHSAEYLAHEISTFCLLQRIVFDIDSNKFWATQQEFLQDKEKYSFFVVYLCRQLLSEDIWEPLELREIARSAEWRLIWCLNKENLASMFNTPVSDLSINQKLVIYWSRVYDSIYEDPDKPDDDIICDDDLLDEWLANRDLNRTEESNSRVGSRKDSTGDHHEQMKVLDGEYIESCTCDALKYNKKVKGLGQKIQHKTDCPHGTWRKFTTAEKDEISREVYGRNSKRTRQILDNEQDRILNDGMIQEQDLRTKKTRQYLGAAQKTIPIRR